MRYVFCLIIVVFVFAGFGCKREPAAVDPLPQDVGASENSIGWTTGDEPFGTEEKIEQETDLYGIHVSLPNTGVEKIDESVRAFINEQIELFKNEPGVLRQADSGTKSGLWITYQTVQASNFVTFVMHVSPYMADAAHPNTYIHTLTFDKHSGAPITLKDILQNGETGLVDLSKAAVTSLKIGGILDLTTEQWLADGTEPIVENFRRFALDEAGLIIYFDPYQLAAYAAGFQSAYIQGTDLRGIIREQYL